LSRYGVIDVGSNTIHLLVGKVEDGEVLPITEEKISARLGTGVEKTGKLEEEQLALAAETIRLLQRSSRSTACPSL
jgi:exopolyphosphatase / guanosine-5'-triphosphate,3'-diphosphate pyrophosphatase